MVERWSREDEAALNRMIARKNDVIAKNMAPLIECSRLLLNCCGNADHLAEALAYYADTFRDALAPFDSGVRAQAEEVGL